MLASARSILRRASACCRQNRSHTEIKPRGPHLIQHLVDCFRNVVLFSLLWMDSAHGDGGPALTNHLTTYPQMISRSPLVSFVANSRVVAYLRLSEFLPFPTGAAYIRLSDLEPRFVCTACDRRGADIRPDFRWIKPGAFARGF